MKGLFIQSHLLSSAGAVNAVSMRLEDKPAYFSMRRNGMTDGPEAKNRAEFFQSLGFDNVSVARAEQVHGTHIAKVESAGVSSKTDALVTTTSRLLLTVSVADCVPILIFDRQKKIASAVHAGWRGTAGNITASAVQYVINNFDSNPSDIVAFVGPSAGVCCYEVGDEVAEHFSGKFLKASANRGKYFLDLKSANAMQLMEKGVHPQNIDVNESCSICDSGFHSFRRDGESSGRMIAAIGFE